MGKITFSLRGSDLCFFSLNLSRAQSLCQRQHTCSAVLHAMCSLACYVNFITFRNICSWLLTILDCLGSYWNFCYFQPSVNRSFTSEQSCLLFVALGPLCLDPPDWLFQVCSALGNGCSSLLGILLLALIFFIVCISKKGSFQHSERWTSGQKNPYCRSLRWMTQARASQPYGRDF